MIKKINFSLYKNLLFCDFFIIRQKFYYKIKSLVPFKMYTFINSLELIKSFKQLMYIIKFIIRNKFSNTIIQTENLISLHIIKLFLKKYILFSKFFIFTSFLTVFSLKKRIKKLNFFYIFLNPDIIENKQIDKLITSRIFLINLIKLKKTFKDQGIYKINTNLFELKQILFFIIYFIKILEHFMNIFHLNKKKNYAIKKKL